MSSFTIYDKDGRSMYETFDEQQAKDKLLEWPAAAYIVGTIHRTVLILRQDCQPCVVSQPKDKPETKK